MKKGSSRLNAFDTSNAIVMLCVSFAILYPLWFSIICSFNDGDDIIVRGVIYWWPRVFTMDNYKVLFKDSAVASAFAVSAARTLFGTAIHVFFTAMVAYSFTKKQLLGRKAYLALGTISLFFSGGLIPYYLLVRNLGLIDNFLVYIIPTAFNFFDAIIFMGFFRTIPESIEESAKIDGANDLYIFWKLIVPLSTPVIATIVIFNGAFNWNDFFYGVMFINRRMDLMPIQTFLYRMVTTTEAYSRVPELSSFKSQIKVTPQSVRIATMVVTTAPIIIVYPFLQKYFVKGVLVGAIKG